MPDLEGAVGGSAAANQPVADSASLALNGSASFAAEPRAPGSASTSAAPIYTPYQLPPMLQQPQHQVQHKHEHQRAASTSAFSPSSSSAPLDPRFPPLPFAANVPGHNGLGSPTDLPDPAHFDAFIKLHAIAAGASGNIEQNGQATDASPPESEAPPKVVQKADRSCKKCRERRVRCGREYPACARCKKRRDTCSYGEGVFVEESVEGSEQQRISDLENKIAALQQQLRSVTSGSNLPPPPSPTTAVPASTGCAPPKALTQASLAYEISRHLTEGLSLSETTTLHNLIAEEGGHQRRDAYGVVDHRLASGGLADAVTCFLLDAASQACDSKHPGFAYLVSRVSFYKSRLRNLEAPEQVAVAILCCLGARASPHHALFGMASVHADNGAPCPARFAETGSRRELVCRALEHRARETAWSTGLYRQRSHDALAAVVGLAQLSLHEENDPDETRCFVRQAAGLFIDIRADDLSRGTPSTLGRSLGAAIFLADAYLSTRCGKPTLISPNDLQEYYVTSGFTVPDLVNMTLGEFVAERGRSPFVPQEAGEVITTLMLYVLACYRVFAQVTSPSRRPDPTSLLGFVRNLWSIVDQVHNAVQRFQQQLVSLPSPQPGGPQLYTSHDVDHAILLAVWADVSLVTLIGHVHAFVQQTRDARHLASAAVTHEELERTRAESFMRVYKCLKLLSFYCQLLCGSRDKHNVFHLLAQLAPLTAWTTLVSLRIGQPGGPVSEEFEVTEEEADWFRMALELSLFYSPRLSGELRELAFARQTYMHKMAPPAPPAALAAAAAIFSGSSAVPIAAHDSLPTAGSRHTLSAPSTAAMQTDALPSGTVSSFSLDVFDGNGQSGFADGAPEDLPGGAAATAAFRSIDWADLSLTPAAGSDGSNGSSDEWMRSRRG